MSDVSTLKTTIAKFDALTQNKPVMAVMDKGFYSKQNIDLLLAQNKQFLIAVPFSKPLARQQAQKVLSQIDRFETLLQSGKESLRVITQTLCWDEKYSVYVHVFFNPQKALHDREKLYARVAQMREVVLKNPVKYVDNAKYRRFFSFEKVGDGDGVFRVGLREGVLELACRFMGMLVILSSHVVDAGEALRVYRAKDVVEKGFLRLKNYLDMGRLRVHSDLVMQNKFFVGFVALILMSHIHSVMLERGLYKTYTLKQLLSVLSKFRVQEINGVKIEFTPTKEVRELYAAFGFNDVL